MAIWLAPTSIKSTICICHHLRLTILMDNPSATPSVLTGRHLALCFIQNRRCVWPLLLSSWRYAALEATRSFPRKMAPFSWSCSASGKWRCQLSFHPVCVTHLPALFQPVSLYPLTPCHHEPAAHSLTPTTCHWKESITLSAHSERAVKRPVGVIKPSEWRAQFS